MSIIFTLLVIFRFCNATIYNEREKNNLRNISVFITSIYKTYFSSDVPLIVSFDSCLFLPHTYLDIVKYSQAELYRTIVLSPFKGRTCNDEHKLVISDEGVSSRHWIRSLNIVLCLLKPCEAEYDHWVYSKDQLFSKTKDVFIIISERNRRKFDDLKYKTVISMTDNGMTQFKFFCFYCKNGRYEVTIKVVTNLTNPVLQKEVISYLQTNTVLNFHGKVLKGRFYTAFSSRNCGKYFNGIRTVPRLCYIQQGLNFTWKLSAEAELDYFPVINSEVDFGIIFYITDTFAPFIDYTFPYFQGGISFMTRTPKEIHTFWIFTFSFDIEVWIMLLITIIIVLYATRCFKMSPAPVSGISLKRQYIFSLVRLHLEQYQRKLYLPVKVFLFYFFFILVINTGYRSKLYSFLTKPDYEKLPSSVKDLLVSQFELLSTESHIHYFENIIFENSAEEERKLFSKIKPVKNLWVCGEQALIRDIACFSTRAFLDHIVRRAIDLQAHSILVQSETSIKTLYASIIFPKDSVYSEEFSYLSNWYQAIGLYFQVSAEDDHYIALKSVRKKKSLQQSLEDNVTTPFGFHTLREVFQLLTHGWSAAFIIVLLEIVHYKHFVKKDMYR